MNARRWITLTLLLTVALCLPVRSQGPPSDTLGAASLAASFAKRTVDSSFYFWDVWAADVGSDDDLDILATGKEHYSDSAPKIAWYENDGAESFTRHFLDNSVGSEHVTAADFDSDGRLDLLADTSSSYSGYSLAWYRNDGSDTFTKHVISDTYRSNWVLPADLDEDDAVDVVSAGRSDLSWWENDGSGSFSHHVIDTQAKDWVWVADVDGDADPDLVVAGDNDAAWWENGGGDPPAFSKRAIASSHEDPDELTTSDIDNDGDIDILGKAAGFPAALLWWENDGSESFAAHTINNSFDIIDSPRPADLDGDGDIDIAAALGNDGLGWWENDGTESFTYHNIVGSSYEGVHDVEIYDVNDDAKLDLVSGRTGLVSGTEVNWWENGMAGPGNLKLAHFRIGHDASLSDMTWYDVTDTAAADVPRETSFRVRFQVYNDGGQSIDWRPQLEWSTTESGGFSTVPTASGAAPFYVASTSHIVDGETIPTEDFALGYGTGSAQAGIAYDTSNPPLPPFSLANSSYTEIEFNVRANANAAFDSLYYFRITDADSPLDAYAVTAAIETAPNQGTVSGQVVDQQGAGLDGVSVTLDSTSVDTTDADGTYSATAVPDTYAIGFTRAGYWDASGTVTVTGQAETTANQVLVAKSGCLGEDTSCALKLIGMVPLVGTAADLVEVASASSDLCEIGQLYDRGEYAQCAAKIALWLAQAAKVPVISQLLDAAEGAAVIQCTVDRLDEVGRTLGKVALAFWDYVEGSAGQETVVVFQRQSAAGLSTASSLAAPALTFTLADAGGDKLRVEDGTLLERSLEGSFALSSDEGYAIGMVSQSSADLTLTVQGTGSGTYDLDVIIPQGDGSSLYLTYPGIAFTADTAGTLEIVSDGTDHGLDLDTNGDGTVDDTVEPETVERSHVQVSLPLVLRTYSPGPQPGWTDDVRVDDGAASSDQLFPDLAVGPDGTLYAVWEDYRNGEYRSNGDVYFASSSDGGRTWTASVRVNDDSAGAAGRRDPRVAASPGGDVYVVWEDWRNDPNPTDARHTPAHDQDMDVYLAKLPAGQSSFQPNVQVLDDPDGQYDPDVVVDGDGNVYVAWYDRTGDITYGNALVAASVDGAASFGAPVEADNHGAWALTPRLAVDRGDDRVYLAYQGHPDYYKPYLTTSGDDGATWSTDERLDAGPDRDWYDAARLIYVAAHDEGHALVLWADERHDPDNCYTGGTSCHDEFDIYANYSGDGGGTWLTDQNVMINDDSTYGRIYAPTAAFGPDGTLVAAWRDSRAGDATSDIWMATSSDYGASWSANRRVDHAPTGYRADYPTVVVAPSGTAYVMWQDDRNGDWDIYLTSAGRP